MAEPETLQTLLRQIASFGDTPAVIAFSGDESDTLSFAALSETALALARALVQRGVPRGEAVAIIAPNSPNWIIAYWAIIAAGAVAVPIDAQIGDEDAARMLATAGCRVVFTMTARAPHLPPFVTAIALDEPPPQTEGSGALPESAPEDVAIILFTSGTTGTPKPVPLTHANILSNVQAILATGLVSRRDRALLPLPLHHAYPLTVGMTTGLVCGVAIVMPAGVSGPEMMMALSHGRASVLLGVPRLYSALVAGIRTQIVARGGLAAWLFPRLLRLSLALRPVLGASAGRLLFRPLRRAFAPDLRLLVSGGAALDHAVEETLAGLGWEVMTGYGLTETSPILSFNRPGAARTGTAGRALPGVSLRIVRADETGVGEIEAQGASVFAGYRDDPEATRKAFTEDGWFRTGDFGRIDADGYLHIVARVSETIVLADGKKLFPEDVESVYAAHPLIKEIGLLAVGGALVGLVVPDFDAVREAGAVRLRELIREALTEKGRTLPSHARLTGFAIARDRLPRTQLGKIRRHLLPALYARASTEREPEAAAELSAEDRALLADSTAAAAWEWIKQRFPGRTLGLDTSPQLDLGIESLGWVDLTLALERDLGASLREQEIARILTLRDLLREIVAAKSEPQRAQPREPDVVLKPLNPFERLLRLVIEGLARIVIPLGFRLRVRGRENLPAHGPFLICPNHESYLDPPVVLAALPHAILSDTWWAGWTGILHKTRLRRLFSRVMQVVPVDVDRAAGAGLAVGSAVLARGRVMAWFPEGARSPDGTLQRFLPGVGVLARQHPVPIVPVHIEGTFECWPIGKPFPPRFLPIAVTFLPPLDPAGFPAMEPQAIADAVHDAIAAAEQKT